MSEATQSWVQELESRICSLFRSFSILSSLFLSFSFYLSFSPFFLPHSIPSLVCDPSTFPNKWDPSLHTRLNSLLFLSLSFQIPDQERKNENSREEQGKRERERMRIQEKNREREWKEKGSRREEKLQKKMKESSVGLSQPLVSLNTRLPSSSSHLLLHLHPYFFFSLSRFFFYFPHPLFFPLSSLFRFSLSLSSFFSLCLSLSFCHKSSRNRCINPTGKKHNTKDVSRERERENER